MARPCSRPQRVDVVTFITAHLLIGSSGLVCRNYLFAECVRLSLRAGGWHDADFIWPSLICHFPLLCCAGYLARQARTSADTLFGLRGARVGKVMITCPCSSFWALC